MLKDSLKIILFSVLCFALTGCARQEVKNQDSQGKNIICFGDSITFGYGVSPGEGYPSRLAKMTKIPVINMGIDGDTSTEALKRLDSDVLDREPLLVLIEFCGNDFLRKVPREVTVSNIGQMIDRIQARGAMAAVVDVSAGMFLSEYRSAFKKLAKEKQALLIPSVLNGIITNPSLKSDFLHPNQKGYKIIAQTIYLAIKPYIEKKPH